MESTTAAETLTPMTEPEPTEQRRRDLAERRRTARPKVTIERLLKAAGYKGVQTWYDTVDGKSPLETVERFEQALDDLIANPADVAEEPAHVASAPDGLIELEVTGDFGVRVVVRAPVANADELERFAAKIIRDIRQGSID